MHFTSAHMPTMLLFLLHAKFVADEEMVSLLTKCARRLSSANRPAKALAIEHSFQQLVPEHDVIALPKVCR